MRCKYVKELKEILKVENLQKSYGDFVALKNIDFSVEYGCITGLLGKNGAGKTTLIKAIIGLFKHYEGNIIYDGERINHNDPIIMSTIGSLVDVKFYEDLSAADNLKILMMATPGIESKEVKAKVNELLELVELKKNTTDKVKSFSFGMKQRLALAQALICDTKLLILDEPFVGLDPLGIELLKQKLRQLCKEKNVAIIFSSHQLAEISDLSDNILVINNGEIGFSGKYRELVDNDKKYTISIDGNLSDEDFSGMNGVVVDEKNREIIIDYNSNSLDSVLVKIHLNKCKIQKVDIVENALLKLFTNEIN